MNKIMCAHCGEAEGVDNGLYCQECADKLGEEYMQEFEVFQLRQLVRDFAIYATKYHKFWQEEKAERDALLGRAIELACEVPHERYTI